ncbi:MAG: HIT domain-containing protein [Thermodesulfobacteriota bacterium]|nr:HIT domain-containing protein [Thermodesulfobacteriota bacterium]
MKTLWAPWRLEHILDKREKECIFCHGLSNDGKLTLYNGSLSMVMMNKYPYTNGHMLVAPKRHVASLEDLSVEEMADLLRMVRDSVGILKKVMNPDGFNVGLNLGAMAGAGVEEHLHLHIVPRWHGDTNVMTVLADVRVISEHLEVTCRNLRPHFEILESAG